MTPSHRTPVSMPVKLNLLRRCRVYHRVNGKAIVARLDAACMSSAGRLLALNGWQDGDPIEILAEATPIRPAFNLSNAASSPNSTRAIDQRSRGDWLAGMSHTLAVAVLYFALLACQGR